MDKTILNLADELKIPKKKLQNKITYENRKMISKIGHIENIDGKETLVFTDKEQDFIKSWYAENDDALTNSDSFQTILKDENSDYLKDYLNKIVEQNEELKKMILRQSIQIAELEKNQQKMLSFSDEREEKKQGFWARLFGGKNDE